MMGKMIDWTPKPKRLTTPAKSRGPDMQKQTPKERPNVYGKSGGKAKAYDTTLGVNRKG